MPKPDRKKEDLRFAVLATDVVLFALKEGVLYTFLIPVDSHPSFKGMSGFPGGLIAPDETALESARRHLKQKGSVDPEKVYLEQLYTFSDVDRDPRGRVVSVAYLALSPARTATMNSNSFWAPVDDVPHLAYDHNAILAIALERLKAKLEYTTIISRLMPKTFTLTELQTAYEIILGRELDKRNFRKKIKDAGVLRSTGKFVRDGAHRPAELFSFKSRNVQMIGLI